jgi:hypothetical protein
LDGDPDGAEWATRQAGLVLKVLECQVEDDKLYLIGNGEPLKVIEKRCLGRWKAGRSPEKWN